MVVFKNQVAMEAKESTCNKKDNCVSANMAAMKSKLHFMNTEGMSEEELARVLDKLECKQCGRIFHKEFGLQYHIAHDH